jgi:hypothetical protein
LITKITKTKSQIKINIKNLTRMFNGKILKFWQRN